MQFGAPFQVQRNTIRCAIRNVVLSDRRVQHDFLDIKTCVYKKRTRELQEPQHISNEMNSFLKTVLYEETEIRVSPPSFLLFSTIKRQEKVWCIERTSLYALLSAVHCLCSFLLQLRTS